MKNLETELQVTDLKTGEIIPTEALEDIIRARKRRRRGVLESKFKNNDINFKELEELLDMMYKDKDDIKILYKSFYKVNMKKPKPLEISHSEYGKFIDMLNFIAYDNGIKHRNGREIKRQDLSDYLQFKNIRGFNGFIKKLSNYGMLAENEHSGVNFLFVNPVYAQRNMKLDSTIYRLFKSDLVEYLNEYQIKYLEMQEDGFDLCSVIPLQK